MKKIDITEINAGVLIAKPQAVTVQITYNGEDAEFDTFIKPYSYDTAVAKLRAFGENKEALAGILAASICDAEGNLQFTEAQVRQNFSQDLTDAIWSKVVEVNSLGKTQNLNPKQNSSVKSQSRRVKASKKSKISHTQKLKSGQPMSENTEASTSVEE
ncbi:phage tail assembly chaperone family protein, TAC [Acinetobacter sp. ANC 5502]